MKHICWKTVLQGSSQGSISAAGCSPANTDYTHHRLYPPASQAKFTDACTSKDLENRVLHELQQFIEAVTNFPTRKAQWVLVAHAGRPVKMFSYCLKKM